MVRRKKEKMGVWLGQQAAQILFPDLLSNCFSFSGKLLKFLAEKLQLS